MKRIEEIHHPNYSDPGLPQSAQGNEYQQMVTEMILTGVDPQLAILSVSNFILNSQTTHAVTELDSIKQLSDIPASVTSLIGYAFLKQLLPESQQGFILTQVHETASSDTTEYELLARTIFADAGTPAELVERFQAHFHNYQRTAGQKMHISALKSGSISCSAAALLAGLQWERMHNAVPLYILPANVLKNPHAHVQVVLPAHTVAESQASEYLKHLVHERERTSVSMECTIRYKISGDVLDSTATEQVPVLQTVEQFPEQIAYFYGSAAFLANRLVTFPIS